MENSLLKSHKVLCVPIAFNEERKIGQVIKKLLEVCGQEDILLIDDSSMDGTVRVAQDLGVRVISHKTRKGVGAAIRTAIQYGLSHQFEILVIIAGNDKDNPSEIPRLLEPIIQEDYDFVQGSRYLPGGSYGNMPLYRQFATHWLHPMMFSLLSGKRVTDSTNGFRAFKLSIFQNSNLDLDQSWLDRYELEPYLFCKVIKLGYKVKEIPVTKIYPPKELGYTKMKPIIGWWSILKPLFYLGLRLRK